ncbi:helicase SRCAP isoform X2 [Polypterus senegalus]|uniref:helicase SRCAP isoform X2 n=1 Tax=Polypterus senegalus TaxID=55291 RepID=UPI0019658C56|nr:helicase SRCAP isoform X2 [Polypterus senegalus]
MEDKMQGNPPLPPQSPPPHDAVLADKVLQLPDDPMMVACSTLISEQVSSASCSSSSCMSAGSPLSYGDSSSSFSMSGERTHFTPLRGPHGKFISPTQLSSSPISLEQSPRPPKWDRSQTHIAEQAKHEADIEHRTSALKREGFWSLKRLSRVPEPSRPKVHWDYLCEEMQWLSADFAQERRWKRGVARKVVRMVMRHHEELRQKEEKAKRDEQAKLRRIASSIAKEVKTFWSNVEKVVQFKQQSRLEEKRKKALDLQLDFIVGQTEKYSDLLSQSLNESVSINRTRGSSSLKDSYPSSLSSSQPPSDDGDFEPHDEEDDEETIEVEEREEGNDAETHLREIELLKQEGELPLEELLQTLPAGVLEDSSGSDDEVEEDDDADESEEEDERQQSQLPNNLKQNKLQTSGNEISVHGHNCEEEDDEEFTANEEEAEDEEETIAAQEEVEGEMNHAEEIEDLLQEGEMSYEQLLQKYAGAYADEFEVPESDGSRQSSEEDESLPDEEEEEEEEEEDEVVEDQDENSHFSGTLEVEESDEDSSGDIGVEFLLKSDQTPPQLARANDKGEEQQDPVNSSPARPKKEITDIAAAAESLQPTGYTLATAQVKTPIPFLLCGTLREYQHIGLDWLVTMYEKKLNGILADEMGLGKTIQTISLLAHLACEKGNWGPHLIIVPTSVMLNWEMEFKRWCPGFKILTYYGAQKERKLKRQGWTKPNAFHVCITSYKLVLQDHQAFRRKNWKYLILDEAQNIKNFKSQRWQSLLNFNSQRRLLLTGTPLQNSLMELWSLMHFLMPHVFQSHREFKEWFSNPLTGMIEGSQEYNENLIKRLHKVLRPFLLRRVKVDVEKQMPKKYEHVIQCRLSKRQRYLYDDFMAQASTRETLASGHFMSVINILMQLRKVCNHPNLFDPRPIHSPFITEGICYTTASLVLRALEPDPMKRVDLGIFDLINLEPRVSRYETDVFLPRKKVTRRLIEEIVDSPDPPPRPKPVKMKVNRMFQPVPKTDGRTVVFVNSPRPAPPPPPPPPPPPLQPAPTAITTSTSTPPPPPPPPAPAVVPEIASSLNMPLLTTTPIAPVPPPPSAPSLVTLPLTPTVSILQPPPSTTLPQTSPTPPSFGLPAGQSVAPTISSTCLNQSTATPILAAPLPTQLHAASPSLSVPFSTPRPTPVAPSAAPSAIAPAVNPAPRLPVLAIRPPVGTATLNPGAVSAVMKPVTVPSPSAPSPQMGTLTSYAVPNASSGAVTQRVLLSPDMQARLPSGEVVSIAQLASLASRPVQTAQGSKPVTFQIQGNKLTLSGAQLHQVTVASQPRQVQGNVVHLVSAGPHLISQPTQMALIQAVTQQNTSQPAVGQPSGSSGATPAAASTTMTLPLTSPQGSSSVITSSGIVKIVVRQAPKDGLPTLAVQPSPRTSPALPAMAPSPGPSSASCAQPKLHPPLAQIRPAVTPAVIPQAVPPTAVLRLPGQINTQPTPNVRAQATVPSGTVNAVVSTGIVHSAVSMPPQCPVSVRPPVAVKAQQPVVPTVRTTVPPAQTLSPVFAPSTSVSSQNTIPPVTRSVQSSAQVPPQPVRTSSAPQVVVVTQPQPPPPARNNTPTPPPGRSMLRVLQSPGTSSEPGLRLTVRDDNNEIITLRSVDRTSCYTPLAASLTSHRVRPQPPPPPRSPFYMSCLDKNKKQQRKERLDRIILVNEHHCGATPIYGAEVLRLCSFIDIPSASPASGEWHKAGYSNCLAAQMPLDSYRPVQFWEQTVALSEAICNPLQRIEELAGVIDRFIFTIPPVEAPAITMHASHAPPSLLHEQAMFRQRLRMDLSPRTASLHRIVCNMRTQFPDLRLIQYDCGKLQTLHVLLRQLKSNGHRVLIFTQMTRMLDVLEQFLNYHGHIYLRLDGSTRVEQRQALMERFNADKRIFCFILSTRSGGVGVNLTGADTVVFYDSDWNPTMDAQAQDRCHRIGQTRDVHIYRLISERTVEENILKKANQKRMLGDMAIEGGNFTTAFFKQQTIRELFDLTGEERKDAEQQVQAPVRSEDEESISSKQASILEQALCKAEDEEDIKAASQAKAEQVAELAEFNENIPLEDGEGPGREEEEELSKAEQEIAALVEQLTPIERYAMNYLEASLEDICKEELKQAEEQVEAARKDLNQAKEEVFRLPPDDEELRPSEETTNRRPRKLKDRGLSTRVSERLRTPRVPAREAPNMEEKLEPLVQEKTVDDEGEHIRGKEVRLQRSAESPVINQADQVSSSPTLSQDLTEQEILLQQAKGRRLTDTGLTPNGGQKPLTDLNVKSQGLNLVTESPNEGSQAYNMEISADVREIPPSSVEQVPVQHLGKFVEQNSDKEKLITEKESHIHPDIKPQTLIIEETAAYPAEGLSQNVSQVISAPKSTLQLDMKKQGTENPELSVPEHSQSQILLPREEPIKKSPVVQQDAIQQTVNEEMLAQPATQNAVETAAQQEYEATVSVKTNPVTAYVAGNPLALQSLERSAPEAPAVDRKAEEALIEIPPKVKDVPCVKDKSDIPQTQDRFIAVSESLVTVNDATASPSCNSVNSTSDTKEKLSINTDHSALHVSPFASEDSSQKSKVDSLEYLLHPNKVHTSDSQKHEQICMFDLQWKKELPEQSDLPIRNVSASEKNGLETSVPQAFVQNVFSEQAVQGETLAENEYIKELAKETVFPKHFDSSQQENPVSNTHSSLCVEDFPNSAAPLEVGDSSISSAFESPKNRPDSSGGTEKTLSPGSGKDSTPVKSPRRRISADGQIYNSCKEDSPAAKVLRKLPGRLITIVEEKELKRKKRGAYKKRANRDEVSSPVASPTSPPSESTPEKFAASYHPLVSSTNNSQSDSESTGNFSSPSRDVKDMPVLRNLPVRRRLETESRMAAQLGQKLGRKKKDSKDERLSERKKKLMSSPEMELLSKESEMHKKDLLPQQVQHSPTSFSILGQAPDMLVGNTPDVPPKRKRGRPPKTPPTVVCPITFVSQNTSKQQVEAVTPAVSSFSSMTLSPKPPIPSSPIRLPTNTVPRTVISDVECVSPVPKRKRGRPPKHRPKVEEEFSPSAHVQNSPIQVTFSSPKLECTPVEAPKCDVRTLPEKLNPMQNKVRSPGRPKKIKCGIVEETEKPSPPKKRGRKKIIPEERQSVQEQVEKGNKTGEKVREPSKNRVKEDGKGLKMNRNTQEAIKNLEMAEQLQTKSDSAVTASPGRKKKHHSSLLLMRRSTRASNFLHSSSLEHSSDAEKLEPIKPAAKKDRQREVKRRGRTPKKVIRSTQGSEVRSRSPSTSSGEERNVVPAPRKKGRPRKKRRHVGQHQKSDKSPSSTPAAPRVTRSSGFETSQSQEAESEASSESSERHSGKKRVTRAAKPRLLPSGPTSGKSALVGPQVLANTTTGESGSEASLVMTQSSQTTAAASSDSERSKNVRVRGRLRVAEEEEENFPSGRRKGAHSSHFASYSSPKLDLVRRSSALNAAAKLMAMRGRGRAEDTSSVDSSASEMRVPVRHSGEAVRVKHVYEVPRSTRQKPGSLLPPLESRKHKPRTPTTNTQSAASRSRSSSINSSKSQMSKCIQRSDKDGEDDSEDSVSSSEDGTNSKGSVISHPQRTKKRRPRLEQQEDRSDKESSSAVLWGAPSPPE